MGVQLLGEIANAIHFAVRQFRESKLIERRQMLISGPVFKCPSGGQSPSAMDR